MIDCSALNEHYVAYILAQPNITSFFFSLKVKKGIVTKGGRFRPKNLALRSLSGPVLLHRSSVNRFDHVQTFSPTE